MNRRLIISILTSFLFLSNSCLMNAQIKFPMDIEHTPLLRVVNKYGISLTKGELLELSMDYGFDYDYYKKVKTLDTALAASWGVMAFGVMPVFFCGITTGFINQHPIPLICGFLGLFAAEITFTCITARKEYEFYQYLDSFNLKVSASGNGVGLAFQF